MAEREIMTLTELAEYLRVHQSTIYRQLKRREIPAFRIGSDWRFSRMQIDQWLEKKGRIDTALGAQPRVGGHPRPVTRLKPG
jgi:excisionase family DNA binding protein